MFDIQEQLKKLPAQPGVYLMKDKFNNIIYVGKAISLKNRVRQYFQSSKNHSSKVKSMVKNIESFEYIITDSELEALILECNLIKQYRPKYNVLLRDDKTYPYIKVTTNEDYPRVLKVRKVLKDKAKYFGPYTNLTAVNDTLEIIRNTYPIRTCNIDIDKAIKNKVRPCLNMHIKKCVGPCTGNISKEEYNKMIEEIIMFLSGKEENLIEILKRLKCKLDEEYDEKRNIQVLQRYYLESMPIMRQEFLTAVVEGKITNEIIAEKLDRLRIDFKYNYFTVGIISLDILNKEKSIFKEENILLPISAEKILKEIMKNICEFTSFLYLDNVIVIGNLKDKLEIKYFINALNEVCRNFKKIVNGSMVIGLGRICDCFSDINLSYKDARSALEYKAILGDEKVIYIEDVEPDSSISLNFDESLERKFVEAIKLGNDDDINSILDEIFNINYKGVLPINQYRIYGIEVLTALIKIMKSYKLNISDIIGENFNEYLYLNNLNSITEIKEWFREKTIKANKAIKNERINSAKILVDKAKQYIVENYSDYDLSVDKMCLVLHLSPAYFSTVFKKETGVSFINYLTDIRMEESIRLLNTTDYKTSIIGQKVGYMEPNYFSYVFKKHFGMSPTRYRKR